ncbi:MAG: sarcosine oxidase subunit delta [Acidimicrobiia bacterium]|nr:sarcosine oxidase subunit delta [Acidimicrobiia bacterium]
MLLVPCPNCGPRNSADLTLVGETGPRPDPSDVTPAAWRAYLYEEENPAGWTRERWFCRLGCQRFFVAERHRGENRFRNPPLGPSSEPSRRT